MRPGIDTDHQKFVESVVSLGKLGFGFAGVDYSFMRGPQVHRVPAAQDIHVASIGSGQQTRDSSLPPQDLSSW